MNHPTRDAWAKNRYHTQGGLAILREVVHGSSGNASDRETRQYRDRLLRGDQAMLCRPCPELQPTADRPDCPRKSRESLPDGAKAAPDIANPLRPPLGGSDGLRPLLRGLLLESPESRVQLRGLLLERPNAGQDLLQLAGIETRSDRYGTKPRRVVRPDEDRAVVEHGERVRLRGAGVNGPKIDGGPSGPCHHAEVWRVANVVGVSRPFAHSSCERP